MVGVVGMGHTDRVCGHQIKWKVTSVARAVLVQGAQCATPVQETFDSRESTVTSRKHLVQIWFALRVWQGKTVVQAGQHHWLNWLSLA